MGARLLTDAEVERARGVAVRRDGGSSSPRSASPARISPRSPVSTPRRREGARSRRCPRTSSAGRAPAAAREADAGARARALAVGRARAGRLRARDRARRPRPHLRRLRARRGVVDRFAARIAPGRILVNAPTAVGALGGVYNSMTPTFSLGCGTWGGSATTDNSTTATCSTSRRSRAARRRRSGSGSRRTPISTPAPLDSLRAAARTAGDDRDRRRLRGARGGRAAAPPRRRERPRVLRHRAALWRRTRGHQRRRGGGAPPRPPRGSRAGSVTSIAWLARSWRRLSIEPTLK